jgi:hypothetical protein
VLATWLLCMERVADAIVDDELLDLGVGRAEALARVTELITWLESPPGELHAAGGGIRPRGSGGHKR